MNGMRTERSPVDIVTSLFILPLFMAASAQTAQALLVVVPVFVVFMLSTFFSVLFSPRVPRSLHSLVRVLIAFFFAWFSWALLSLLFPLYSLVFQFSFMLVPVAWLGSGRAGYTQPRDTLLALGDAALEALSLSLMLMGGAVLREMISTVSLSLPGEGGASYLFTFEAVLKHAPGPFAGSVGALALFVGVRMVYPAIRLRMGKSPGASSSCGAESSVVLRKPSPPTNRSPLSVREPSGKTHLPADHGIAAPQTPPCQGPANRDGESSSNVSDETAPSPAGSAPDDSQKIGSRDGEASSAEGISSNREDGNV